MCHLLWDGYALRAFADTLSASDTEKCRLPVVERLHSAHEFFCLYGESLAGGVAVGVWQHVVVDERIVDCEILRNVDAVGAWHAPLAVNAVYL